MNTQITRRKFVAAAGISALAAPSLAQLAESQAASPAPQILTPGTVKPAVISAANGNRSKDAEGRTGVVRAFEMITAGADVLDAVIAGVNIVELDPEDTSVGYGGLPNADGVVQLDASVMHGPLKRAGGVGCLEGVRTPSLVAKAVMDQTDHVLLVGRGAQRFARNLGFKIERDLNTEKSRMLWLEWKRRTDLDHYLDPKKRAEAGARTALAMAAEGLFDADHINGTINCNGINAKGEVCGVTTTSGLAFKIPGRVGDSPIIGAGLYVDGDVGACGSTGRGESNLLSLACALVVEAMRHGTSPKDAGLMALKRVAALTVEKRLLNDRGQPNFNLNYYMLNTKGEHACVAFYASRYALCTESGPQSLDAEAIYPGAPQG